MMGSVLHSRILNVAGRSYRVLTDPQTVRTSARLVSPQKDNDESHVLTEDRERGAIASADALPQKTTEQSLLNIQIDNALVGFIIGSKGSKKAAIERDTGASISITSKNRNPTEQADVSIKGSSPSVVDSAAARIHLTVADAIASNRTALTHFLSLPLVNADFTQKLKELQTAILEDPEAEAANIDESIFVDPRTLHLTLVVMKLYSAEKRQRALAVLEQLNVDIAGILKDRPLRIQVQGLRYMNDDPSAIHVLYFDVGDMEELDEAKFAGMKELKTLIDLVVDRFRSEDLLAPSDDREVKLHATFINTRHRKSTGSDVSPTGSPRPSKRWSGGRKRIAIDGHNLLGKFEDFALGPCTISSLHLSKMQEKTADGYYASAKVLKLGN